MLLSFSEASDYEFAPKVKINDISTPNISTSSPGQHSIVIKGNNLFVAWGADFHVYFAKSTDGGLSFSEPVIVAYPHESPDPLLHVLPSLAVDASGENIHLTWYSDNGKIWYSKSNDGGATFSSPRYIAGDVPPNGCGIPSWSPSIAIFGQNVYIAYADVQQCWWIWEHSFIKSSDGGETFSTPARLNIPTEDLGVIEYAWSGGPILEVDGQGNLYVAWAAWFYGNEWPIYSGPLGQDKKTRCI